MALPLGVAVEVRPGVGVLADWAGAGDVREAVGVAMVFVAVPAVGEATVLVAVAAVVEVAVAATVGVEVAAPAVTVVVSGAVTLAGGVIDGVPGPGVGTVAVGVGGTTGGLVTRLASVPWAAAVNNTTWVSPARRA